MRILRRILAMLRHLSFRWRLKALELKRTPLAADRQKRFLFWVPGGMPLMLDVEASVALALRLRGHRVHAVMCDGVAKACVRREIKLNPDISSWSRDCVSCRKDYAGALKRFNLEYSSISDHLSPERIAELRQVAAGVSWEDLADFRRDGVDVGGNIKSSILRYLKGEPYNGDPELLREYVFSGLVTLEACSNAIATFRPTNLFMSHGMYVDWGPALRLALQKGLRVTCWIASYLHARFYFRHPTDTRYLDFHKITDSRWVEEKAPLGKEQADRLDEYQRKRYTQGQSFDMKEFKGYQGTTERLRARFGFGNDKKTWAIFAHVNWDCVSDFSPMLFEDFNEWVVSTLETLRGDTSVNWLLKVHPAEAWDNPATGIQALVRRHFPQLPPHIRLIGFDEDINPLDFFNLVDGAVTVYGTSGLELATLGKPVIAAGEAHYARKGFTYDPATRQEYHAMLRSVASMGPLSREQTELARRYSYLYFIQRQVLYPPVRNRHASKESSFWSFDIGSRHMLLPDGDRHVDFILDRIVDGEEFILPDQLVPQ